MSMPVTLQTERLTLRVITASDINHIHAGLSNPDVIRFYGVSYPTLEDTKEQMDWYQGLLDNNTGIWWTMTEGAENRFIGAIGINDLEETHKKAEIGFWLLPEFWGKGYVVEAANSVMNYANAELNIHRLEAFVETENSGSEKVLSKLGFAKEGVLRDSEIKNGKFISLSIYSYLF